MLKKTVTLAIVCLVSSLAFAQKKFTFKLGQEYSLPKKSEDLAFIGNNQDGIINLSLKKDELYITRFDGKSLKTTSEKEVNLSDATKNMNSETVVQFGNKYYWLNSDWDKSAKVEYLYASEIDINKGAISDKKQTLVQSSRLTGSMASAGTGFFSSNIIKLVNKYRFNLDADKTKLLVTYRLYPESKSDKVNYDKIGFFVFDENMKKLWGSEFQMPYTEARMNNLDYTVDANGDAYMLVSVTDDDGSKSKDGPAYHLEVFRFTKGKKKPIIAKIDLGGNYLKQASLIESSTHEILIACTYSKKAKKGGTAGIYLGKLNNENGKLENYKNGYYEFSKEELLKFEAGAAKRKIEKKDDYEAPNIVVRNIVIEPDGGVLVACEEYLKEVNTTFTSRGTRTTITYDYDDILAAKIDAAGNFQWIKKIPKNQRGINTDPTLGYKLISDASGYYFLYVDNSKNLNLPADEAPRLHMDGYGGQVVVAKIDKSGNINKEILFDTREEDVKIFPREFKKINDNEFIGRAQVKKTLFQPLLIKVN